MFKQPQPWGSCLLCERDRLRKALGAVAVDALQNNWEDVLEWARGVRIEFTSGEPEVTL